MPSDELPTSPRLSYEIDGNILTLRASGSPTLHDRKLVYDAVRADATAPKGANLLWDIRDIDVAMFTGYAVVRERFSVLVEQLGPSLGHVCGMLVPAALADQADMFQEAGARVGLRVRAFNDEPSARLWLAALPLSSPFSA